MKNAIIFFSLIILYACSPKPNGNIVQKSDIEQFIQLETDTAAISLNLKEIEFWSKKLENAPNQHPYISKIASHYEQLFAITENVDYLNKTISLLTQVITATNHKSANSLRSLARNCISAHQFTAANTYINEAYALGENKIATEKMRFDIALEIGNYDQAKQALKTLEQQNDFDFLIREAKWQDHIGKTDAANFSLEKAKLALEGNDDNQTKSWILTNLADFYGHTGKLDQSYQYYIQSLNLNPHDSYALKGIANIALSSDKNYALSTEIVEKLNQRCQKPEYYLLLAEIAELQNNQPLQSKYQDTYFELTQNPKYGNMYNKYTINLKPSQNLNLALYEVQTRPTPETYAWLANVYYSQKELKKAETIINEKVIDKTYEPESLLIAANILKSLGNEDKVSNLKKELLTAKFELGQINAQKIDQL